MFARWEEYWWLVSVTSSSVITFPDKNLMKTEDRILSVTIWGGEERILNEFPQKLRPTSSKLEYYLVIQWAPIMLLSMSTSSRKTLIRKNRYSPPSFTVYLMKVGCGWHATGWINIDDITNLQIFFQHFPLHICPEIFFRQNFPLQKLHHWFSHN